MSISNQKIEYFFKRFDELTTKELYEILKLRQDIFVVEQNCPYLDCDDKDYQAWHLWATIENHYSAYTRILPKGISYDDYSSIGRVATNKVNRNTGLGYKIMEKTLTKMKSLFPNDTIKISSQVYIMPFYAKFGFVEVGEEYLEDDIPHHAMILSFAK